VPTHSAHGCAQEVGQVTAVDSTPCHRGCKAPLNPHWPLNLAVHDMLAKPYLAAATQSTASTCPSTLPAKARPCSMRNLLASLDPNGAAIVGIPRSNRRRTRPQSKAGHVNCKSGGALQGILLEHFHNVSFFR